GKGVPDNPGQQGEGGGQRHCGGGAVETEDGFWCILDGLGDQALPTVMKKVVAHAILNSGPPDH
ncbi:MAG: hypothetical protein RLT05_20400, partial [Bauldia litoralis]